jgi:hypothetical protein
VLETKTSFNVLVLGLIIAFGLAACSKQVSLCEEAMRLRANELGVPDKGTTEVRRHLQQQGDGAYSGAMGMHDLGNEERDSLRASDGAMRSDRASWSR